MTTDFIEKLEAYLAGKINRSVLEDIAKEQGISKLEEEIEWYQDSLSAIQASGLRKQLKEILPTPEKKTAKIVSLGNRRWIMGIAASFLLIVVAYFGFFRGESKDLYAQYEYIDPGLPVLMSQSDDFLFYDAMSYFGEGNYAVAEEKLLEVQGRLATSDTLTYYLAVSRLYQGKTDLVFEPLSQVASNEASRFKQRAEWLMVLMALKAKRPAEAQQRLAPILEVNDHDFHKKALELQEKLSQ